MRPTSTKLRALLQKNPSTFPKIPLLPRPATFTTTLHPHGIISKDRDDTLDPSKEATDTTAQAKNPGAANPAQQQANVAQQQSGGRAGDGAAQTQTGGDSELTEKKKRGEVKGEKHGEAAVNPAVKGSG